MDSQDRQEKDEQPPPPRLRQFTSSSGGATEIFKTKRGRYGSLASNVSFRSRHSNVPSEMAVTRSRTRTIVKAVTNFFTGRTRSANSEDLDDPKFRRSIMMTSSKPNKGWRLSSSNTKLHLMEQAVPTVNSLQDSDLSRGLKEQSLVEQKVQSEEFAPILEKNDYIDVTQDDEIEEIERLDGIRLTKNSKPKPSVLSFESGKDSKTEFSARGVRTPIQNLDQAQEENGHKNIDEVSFDGNMLDFGDDFEDESDYDMDGFEDFEDFDSERYDSDSSGLNESDLDGYDSPVL